MTSQSTKTLRQAKDSLHQPMYSVEPNRCDCHPETCSCDPWVLLEDGKRITSFYNKKDADDTCKKLNALEQLKKESNQQHHLETTYRHRPTSNEPLRSASRCQKPRMESVDLQHLEDLAKKATAGPWSLLDEGDLLEIQGDSEAVITETFDSSKDPERDRVLPNMEYIIAADPQTMLGVIAMIRDLKDERDILAIHLNTIKKARHGLMVRTLERGLAEAIDDTPLPALQRRDMEMEADILDRVAEEVDNAGTAQRLIDKAETLRQQAGALY